MDYGYIDIDMEMKVGAAGPISSDSTKISGDTP